MRTLLCATMGVLLLAVVAGCDEARQAELAEQAAKAREDAKLAAEEVSRVAGEVGQRAQKAATEATLGKPTLVINLTSGEDDLHAVAMGLHLAEHGLEAGREVVIFFNVKSPPLARKSLPDSVRFDDQEPVGPMIASLVERGAKCLVCAMCAEATGVTADELAPGIEMIADRSQLFDALQANTVVFSY